jgi:hypothetical protein
MGWNLLPKKLQSTVFGKITDKIAQGTVKSVALATGITSTQEAIKAEVAGIKAGGTNWLKAIPGTVIVGITKPIGDVANDATSNFGAKVVNPKVGRGLSAFSDAAIKDPANSLKVDVGIVGVAAGIVTANPVAIAAGGASIAIGVAGLVDDTNKALSPPKPPAPIPDIAALIKQDLAPIADVANKSPAPAPAAPPPSVAQRQAATAAANTKKAAWWRRALNWVEHV